MNGPWRSLGTAWRLSSAVELWPRAAAGVRDWQHALAEAAPAGLHIDPWPREPDVARLLQPLAQSPLQDPQQLAAAAPPPADTGQRTAQGPGERAARGAQPAPGAANRYTAATPAHSGAADAPPHRGWAAGGSSGVKPAWAPDSATAAAGATAPGARWPVRAAGGSPTAAPASGPSTAAPARVAALLARFAAQRPLPTSAPAGAAQGLRPKTGVSASHRATPAFGNVVPLRGAAGFPFQARLEPHKVATPGQALKWRHWSRVLDRAAWGATGAAATAAAPEIAALLARGQQASFDDAAAPALLHAPAGKGLAAATAALRPSAQASSHPGPAATSSPTAWRGPSERAVAEALPAPADGGDALASLSASMARLESQLAASASASASATASAQTPVAPQWLSDDDTLAERIHDILRRQARRHGIDTP